MDWDNLRFLLATARAGTFSGAASELQVNRTTVARRVANLEAAAGTPLFDPSSDGLRPTTAGKKLLQTARAMEQQIEQATSLLADASSGSAGPLRVAAPIGLGAEFMPQIIGFCQRYPDIELELLTVADPAQQVSERQADLALVVSNQPPEHLEGPLICELHRAVYAGLNYLDQHDAERPLHQHQWVGWGRIMANTLVAKWMKANLPADTRVTAQVNSWTAMKEAVAGGLGISQLWCFLADEDTRLRRLREPDDSLGMNRWLLGHQHIPPSQRMQALLDYLPATLARRVQASQGDSTAKSGRTRP